MMTLILMTSMDAQVHAKSNLIAFAKTLQVSANIWESAGTAREKEDWPKNLVMTEICKTLTDVQVHANLKQALIALQENVFQFAGTE